VAGAGYRAAKFGWGPYGRGTVPADAEQVHAAREGLGKGPLLLIDAGTVWGEDVEQAAQRIPALQSCETLWLEEPFVSGALKAYGRLASLSGPVKLAAGEGCHDLHQAKNMIDYAALGFVQIDAGRVGGITIARQVADYAHAKGLRYVNHTFTTHLALSASVQPYAGFEAHQLCEYPAEPSLLAQELTQTKLQPDANGCIRLPEKAGLGLEPDWQAIKKYLVEVQIRVDGKLIFQSPAK
jgi:L-alanine-DL-glutamate epimerase-like enolase superfamily enzyme